jgi:hypothetical protein
MRAAMGSAHLTQSSIFQPPLLVCFYPLTESGEGQEELALDVEFENEWEMSDWNEDDGEDETLNIRQQLLSSIVYNSNRVPLNTSNNK